MPATTSPSTLTGMPPAPGNSASGDAAAKPGGDRRGDRRHPVQVLGARDLLRRRDPGLGPGPRHAARPAGVHPGRRDERAGRRPPPRSPPRRPSCSALSTARCDQRPGLGEAEVARMPRRPWLRPRPCCSRRPRPCTPPVMWEASSVARNSAVPATSAGPRDPPHRGQRAQLVAPAGLPVLAAERGLGLDEPGAKMLTRTVGANACAYDLVMPRIPYFAAAYCGARALPRTMTVEPMLTIAAVALVEHPAAELVHAQQRALDVDGQHVVDRLLGDVAPRHLVAGDVADVVRPSTSTPPSASKAASAIALIWSQSTMSACSRTASLPSAAHPLGRLLRPRRPSCGSGHRPPAAPSWAARTAISAPKPVPAPVTTTDRPSKRRGTGTDARGTGCPSGLVAGYQVGRAVAVRRGCGRRRRTGSGR